MIYLNLKYENIWNSAKEFPLDLLFRFSNVEIKNVHFCNLL